MKTNKIILGQTTYEVSRFFKKEKTVKDVLKDRIIQNLARQETVDDPPRKAV